MPEQTGVARPGGRTARTRAAVHAAARELLAEREAVGHGGPSSSGGRGSGSSGDLSLAAVAERAGVHPTTLYRRWGTLESLLLDLAVDRVTQESPVPATGDLRADLTKYVHRLLTGLHRAGSSSLLQALMAAAAQEGSTAQVRALVEPRVAQFQAMLDAAGVTTVDGLRVVELVLAPAYLWTQLASPLDPDEHTERLVDAILVLTDRSPQLARTTALR